MKTLEQALGALRADQRSPALDDLEDRVWTRIGRLEADEAEARRWRGPQLLAVALALVSGIAWGGYEADAWLRDQPPSLSLTGGGIAPSDLLEGRG